VPGAVDPGVVKVLVDGIEKPLNVMAGPALHRSPSRPRSVSLG
jgi:hypothetical protein